MLAAPRRIFLPFAPIRFLGAILVVALSPVALQVMPINLPGGAPVPRVDKFVKRQLNIGIFSDETFYNYSAPPTDPLPSRTSGDAPWVSAFQFELNLEGRAILPKTFLFLNLAMRPLLIDSSRVIISKNDILPSWP